MQIVFFSNTFTDFDKLHAAVDSTWYLKKLLKLLLVVVFLLLLLTTIDSPIRESFLEV